MGEIADVLSRPSWLTRQNVVFVRIIAGYDLLPAGDGERVLVIMICLPQADDTTAVKLRVEGKPSANELFDALQGKATHAAALKINAVMIYPSEDWKLISRILRKLPMKLRWLRNWEITFSNSDPEAYSQQLDFFGIRLAASTQHNDLACGFTFPNPKPDTRIVSKPDDEMIHYLSLRSYVPQQADRVLLKRVGIDGGTEPILMLLPPDIEAKLAGLEESFRGANPKLIREPASASVPLKTDSPSTSRINCGNPGNRGGYPCPGPGPRTIDNRRSGEANTAD